MLVSWSERSAVVRALVNVVATVATVMHLTFGCCLHAAHFGPADSCHDCGVHVRDTASCCGEHEHEVANEGAADETLQFVILAASSGNSNAGHDCAGCSCVAATEDIVAARWMPAASVPACEGTIVTVPTRGARAGRTRDRGGAATPRDANPLHERLLV